MLTGSLVGDAVERPGLATDTLTGAVDPDVLSLDLVVRLG